MKVEADSSGSKGVTSGNSELPGTDRGIEKSELAKRSGGNIVAIDGLLVVPSWNVPGLGAERV